MGKLYVVGTPIGNLGDFSRRGIDTLNNVDFIAAEDTRLSQKLLNHYNISTPLVSYHQHNQKERGEEIVARIEDGETWAIISDAGMPAISDPGEDLVRLCRTRNVDIEVVPGPTAVASALAVSGFPSKRFIFEGFLSGTNSQKKAQLLEVARLPLTLIYYEAPHKVLATLKLMLEVFGNRNISVSRELTKLYEETLHFSLAEAVDYYSESTPRGEFVIIVEGNHQGIDDSVTFETAVEMVISRKEQGVPLSAAAKEVAQITGYKKSQLYKAAL